MNPQELKSKFQIPPQQQAKFESMVAACMKVLYSDVFKDSLMSPGEGNNGNEMAKAAFSILVMVNKEFKGSLPGELFLPVGLYLIAEIADFTNQSGVDKIEAAEIGQAMEVFIGLLMRQANATGAQVEQALKGAPA